MINQELINQIAPMLTTCVLGVATAVIKTVGSAAISYLEKKKEGEAVKIGVDIYNSNLDKAMKVWGIVDEYFRITPTVQKTIDTAQAKFAEEITKVIPGLSTADIDHLRQAVAGEVNKGKEAITAPVKTSPTVIQAAVKYVAPDGTELKPVDSTNEQATSDTSQNNQTTEQSA